MYGMNFHKTYEYMHHNDPLTKNQFIKLSLSKFFKGNHFSDKFKNNK